MKNENSENNQWLVYELKICRAAVGMTQSYLSELLGESVEVIKRIETKFGDPKHRTITRIRKIYNHLGISCKIESSGKTTLTLNSDLVKTINQGELKKYSTQKGETLNLTSPVEYLESTQLKDLVHAKNQWFMLEIKLCRIISGLTQQTLADLMDMKLEGIKRLERGGSEPRYSTLNKLRRIFDYMGVRCSFDDFGNITINLRKELIEAINSGKHTAYKAERPQSFTMENGLIKFE